MFICLDQDVSRFFRGDNRFLITLHLAVEFLPALVGILLIVKNLCGGQWNLNQIMY